MRVLKWMPNFDIKSKLSIAPLHLFYKHALHDIASLIGCLLKDDEPTADQIWPSIARVCIEVEKIALVHEEIVIDQRVIYENYPSYYHTCRHLCHKHEYCYGKWQSLSYATTEGDGEKESRNQGREAAYRTWWIQSKIFPCY
ncbi:hypothetical protein Pfo_027329 [Paulownia fortunei]|nr:hypothetical protein Pfo_027329 [Paulownia fortunei]